MSGKKRLFIDEGTRYGKLLVIKELEPIYKPNHGFRRYYLCQCDCGNITRVRSDGLSTGQTQSCGCLNRERLLKKNTKHGDSKTLLYHVWAGFKNRCYSTTSGAYVDYGGRGISVCEEWLHDFESFKEWALENGYEKGLSLDRIDNNKNYEPNNCRWVTTQKQNRNKRTNHNLTFLNETHCLVEWSEITGIKTTTLLSRLRAGWSLEKTLTTPVKKRRK